MSRLNINDPVGNGGKSLCQAVLDKYVDGEREQTFSNCEIKVSRLRTNSGGSGSDGDEAAPPIPPYIVLDNADIASVGNVERLHQLCAEVTELDLASNRLRDLAHVLDLLRRLPRLEFCNLSCNPLAASHLESHHTQDAVPVRSVKRLVLNNTAIPWSSLYSLLGAMVSVEELHLSLNDYGVVEECSQPPLGGSHATMKILHFNRNGVESWAELDKLGRTFPNLETLVVAENPRLEHLGPEPAAHFPRLHSLNLNKTGVAGWEVVDRLWDFPELRDVRLQSIPLLEPYTPEQRRFLTVARLPGTIQRLNASTVSPEERFNAERAFIRYYMSRGERPRRYHQLVEKHGQLDPLVQVSLAPVLEINCLVKMQEDGEFPGEGEGEMRQILMRIPLKQTVAQFKRSLTEFSGLPAAQMRLFHLDRENGTEQFHQELTWSKMPLYSYKPHDRDEFLIVKK